MDEMNWYDQPIENPDDWSDVSDLQGYDSGGNWTGENALGDSIFGNIPVMDNWDSWNNPESGLSFNYSPEGAMPGYNEFGNWTGENIDFNIQDRMTGPQGLTAPMEQGGSQDFLSRLFANPTMLAKGIGALFEGSQNKRRAGDLRAIAQKAPFDPFGSQRPVYQQEMQRAIQDPYSAPIVKAQVEQLARAQQIADAKAGRRSNNAGSAPALIAAQAKIAQDYINSLQRPAGAYINPEAGGMANLLSQASAAGNQGYISPLLSVLGNYTRTNQTGGDERQAAIDAIMRLSGRG